MANLVKYTGETLTATLGTLADGHHLSYSYVKANSNYISGLTAEYKAFKGASTGSLSITNSLVTSSGAGTSSTVTITAKPYWDNGNFGAECSNTVEIRQATTFNRTPSIELWVGTTGTMSYTLTNTPYDKGVAINAAAGSISAISKAASASSTSATVTALKSGTSTVSFTPNTDKGSTGKGSTTVTVRQQITEIVVDKTSVNVNSGGSVTIGINVSATNTNDSNATANIYRPVLFHKFDGTATGSNSTSAAITVAKGTAAPKQLKLTNITKGGTITLAALAGAPTTTNAAIPSGASVTKTITISLKSLTITLYKDSACVQAKKENAINAGDYFFIKVTGGAGTTGTVSCTTAGITIGTASISDNGGSSKITVATTVTSNFTIKFTPSNGSEVTKDVTIKTPTITLS